MKTIRSGELTEADVPPPQPTWEQVRAFALTAVVFLFPWHLYFRTLRRLRLANKPPAVAPYPSPNEPTSAGPRTGSQP